MDIPPGLQHLVSSDPDFVGGELCFIGTRVPLETVVDNLAAGHTAERILANFPSLRREHIEAVRKWERELALDAVGLSHAS